MGLSLLLHAAVLYVPVLQEAFSTVGLSASDWLAITDMTVTQLRARIRMRNAQFGRPLPEDRLARLLDGAGEPVKFDYRRAQRSARSNAERPR